MVQHFFILAAVASSQVGKQKRRHAVFFFVLFGPRASSPPSGSEAHALRPVGPEAS